MNAFSDLKTKGTTKVPHGKLTRDGKSVVFEGTQQIRATIPFELERVESAAASDPMIVLLESVMDLRYTDFVKRIAWLTPREHEVFREMGMGVKSSVIADRLKISTKTLDIHRANIGRKLGLKNLNAFGRAYWFYRLCDEVNPNLLREAQEEVRQREG